MLPLRLEHNRYGPTASPLCDRTRVLYPISEIERFDWGIAKMANGEGGPPE